MEWLGGFWSTNRIEQRYTITINQIPRTKQKKKEKKNKKGGKKHRSQTNNAFKLTAPPE